MKPGQWRQSNAMERTRVARVLKSATRMQLSSCVVKKSATQIQLSGALSLKYFEYSILDLLESVPYFPRHEDRCAGTAPFLSSISKSHTVAMAGVSGDRSTAGRWPYGFEGTEPEPLTRQPDRSTGRISQSRKSRSHYGLSRTEGWGEDLHRNAGK